MELNTKLLFKFSLYVLCSALTIQALNVIVYKSFSMFTVILLLVGPISTVILFKRQNWLRGIIGIVALSGLFGLAYIGQSYARLFVYGNALSFSEELYLYHGVLSIIFILFFIVWYYLFGRKENENQF